MTLFLFQYSHCLILCPSILLNSLSEVPVPNDTVLLVPVGDTAVHYRCDYMRIGDQELIYHIGTIWHTFH